MRRGKCTRRGVLLLVMLSLLALFSVVVVTYVVVAGLTREAATAAARLELYGTKPEEVMERLALDLLRDTNNPLSPMRSHSLLADLYGDDGIRGNVSGPAQMTVQTFLRGELLDIPVQGPLNALDGYYNGCVFTLISGPLAGRSGRVVDYFGPFSQVGPRNTVRVFGLSNFRPNENMDQILAQLAENEFLINGRPFNGTGVGYEPNSNRYTATDNGLSLALLPNPKNSTYESYFQQFRQAPFPFSLTDEDYDAVDAQNMFLAMPVPVPLGSSTPFGTSGQYVAMPSFHRPDLMRYWQNKEPGRWGDLSSGLKQSVVMRPLSELHPLFASMNPAYEQDPIYQNRAVPPPWDVDNDGDGLTDSIWIDPGYPVETAPDGRRYKTLAAILCVDLDGRFHLNAHGGLAHVNTNLHSDPVTGPFAEAGGVPPADLPAGLGYGPADVDLTFPVQTAGAATPLPALFNIAQLRRLLQGDTTQQLPGRYGELNTAQVSGLQGPGSTMGNDPRAALKHQHYPQDRQTRFSFTDYSRTASSFGTPPDLWGVGRMGIDFRGQPLYRSMAGWDADGRRRIFQPVQSNLASTNFVKNNPYELNLSQDAPRASRADATTVDEIDAPFTWGEIERLLRYNDRDAPILPGRLAKLLPDVFGDNENDDLQQRQAKARKRALVTAEGWDLPVPNIQAPPQLAQILTNAGQPQPLHVVDLLKARLLQHGMNPTDAQTLNDAARFYFSPDLLAGLRFDLNRPFGDGQDSNNAGTIDEREEMANDAVRFYRSQTLNQPPETQPVTTFHHNNGELLAPHLAMEDPRNRLEVRQIYARYLYMLAMILLDDNYPVTPRAGEDEAAARARIAAQWAVNVVDFRDRDGAMTYFEYDVHPFRSQPITGEPDTGHVWNVDGDPSTGTDGPQRGEVWGCERPELLITEVLAVHDRRTRDDTAGNGTVQDGRDDDWDQIARPKGSLVVELFNPQSPHDAPTFDLAARGVDIDRDEQRDYGVDLRRRDRTGNWPVWRLVVADRPNNQNAGEPEDTVLDSRRIERIMYFTEDLPETSGGTDVRFNLGNGRIKAFSLARNQGSLIVYPNHYAVVAPHADTTAGNGAEIGFGRRDTTRDGGNQPAFDYPLTLRFTRQDVAVVDQDGGPIGLPLTDRKPALGVLVSPLYQSAAGAPWVPTVSEGGRKIRFSISEPRDGYPINPGRGDDPRNDDTLFTSVVDQPFDNPADNPDLPNNDETRPNFKVLYLQRLANPIQPWADRTQTTDPANPLTYNPYNPYITVDTLPIDLTTYTGEWTTDQFPGGNGFLTSRQRDGGPSNDNRQNIWTNITQEPSAIPDIPSVNDPPEVKRMGTTLGYLNMGADAFGQPLTSVDAPPGSPLEGYRGDPRPTNSPTQPGFGPFPWFMWNNRPFVSEMELMLVPRTDPANLLSEHEIRDQNESAYNPRNNNDEPEEGEFAFLMNFFDSGNAGQGAGVRRAPHWYRILEYTRVPSPFVGNETVLNAAGFGANDPRLDRVHLRPPFHVISDYREPGRVNINTIYAQEVWEAIRHRMPGANWPEIVESRRGYTASGATTPADPFNMLNYDDGLTFASIMGNPFRSFGGGHLRPPPVVPGVDVTFLRPEPGGGNRRNPLLSPNQGQGYNNPIRNPYFRYHGHQRMANLLTTRSNTFAVWITIGYFEVLPPRTRPRNEYLDGWEIGREMGADTGNIRRHRGFYIVDRSLPVAYEPGEDHNVRDAMVVKRFIE